MSSPDTPPALGILMLDTRFPRLLGDVGNPETFDFPVHYRKVAGASANKVVRGDPLELTDRFIEAGRELVAMGCVGITTTCGFLALVQDRLKDALGVPVAASSLMQIPLIEATLPADKRVGVLTISGESLTAEHLKACGARPDTPIVGTETGTSFTRAILQDHETLDMDACRQDMLAAAKTLTAKHPEVGAITLECTNMAPYAADIQAATQLPVYSANTFIEWFWAGLQVRGQKES